MSCQRLWTRIMHAGDPMYAQALRPQSPHPQRRHKHRHYPPLRRGAPHRSQCQSPTPACGRTCPRIIPWISHGRVAACPPDDIEYIPRIHDLPVGFCQLKKSIKKKALLKRSAFRNISTLQGYSHGRRYVCHNGDSSRMRT